MVDSLLLLSRIFGWTYTIAWSASFTPQALLNYRRQTVAGVSLDFLYSNVAGFVAYSAFNVALYFSPEIRRQYFERYESVPPLALNDVIFPVYALAIASFTLGQSFYYPREQGQRLSSAVKTALTVTGMVVLAALALVLVRTLEWLDLFNLLAVVKLAVSAVKYTPQVLENYKRQSTEAWSIHQILLDATGGIFSTAQLFLDAGRTHDYASIIHGGLPKLLLGVLAMSFDAVFCFQHYVLYRGARAKAEGERQRLLGEEEER